VLIVDVFESSLCGQPCPAVAVTQLHHSTSHQSEQAPILSLTSSCQQVAVVNGTERLVGASRLFKFDMIRYPLPVRDIKASLCYGGNQCKGIDNAPFHVRAHWFH
jgi:hypothetical protein